MRLTTTLFVILVLAVLSLGTASEAGAVGPYCTSCYTICQNTCAARGLTCSIVWNTCGGECGGGLAACVYACSSGPTYTEDCYCSSCPGGSPIFRKHPTQPAPTGTPSQCDDGALQTLAPPVVTPAPAAVPAVPAANTPARPAEPPTKSSSPATVCP
jgi:hypothetical protein